MKASECNESIWQGSCNTVDDEPGPIRNLDFSCVQDNAFQTSVVNDISTLKSTVDILEHEIQTQRGQLNKGSTSTNKCDTCLLYVRLKHPIPESLNTTLLESKLCSTAARTPVTNIMSDRMCGIRIKKSSDNDDNTWISVIGVYLPCLDSGVDLYRDTCPNHTYRSGNALRKQWTIFLPILRPHHALNASGFMSILILTHLTTCHFQSLCSSKYLHIF